jgi:hypothetical protein
MSSRGRFALVSARGVLAGVGRRNLATKREAPRSTEGERRDESRAC